MTSAAILVEPSGFHPDVPILFEINAALLRSGSQAIYCDRGLSEFTDALWDITHHHQRLGLIAINAFRSEGVLPELEPLLDIGREPSSVPVLLFVNRELVVVSQDSNWYNSQLNLLAPRPVRVWSYNSRDKDLVAHLAAVRIQSYLRTKDMDILSDPNWSLLLQS